MSGKYKRSVALAGFASLFVVGALVPAILNIPPGNPPVILV